MNVRILHDGGWIHPGGGASVAVEMAKALDAPITVGHTDCPEWWAEKNVDVEIAFNQQLHDGLAANVIDRPALRPVAELRLGQLFKSLSPDEEVVISSGTVAKWWIPRHDQTHIHYCHTPPPRLYSEPTTSPLAWVQQAGVRQLDRDFSQYVSAYIANSEFTKERVSTHYGRWSEVIHPPVRTDRFDYQPPSDDPYFVMIGRLVPMKRANVVAEAFQWIDDARLVMLGDGPLRAECEAIDGVSVYPNPPDWVVEQTVARSVGGIAFAEEEHCGITPKEIQAAGKPVIVPDEPNLHNHVEDRTTGVIVPPTTPGVREGVAEVLNRTWHREDIQAAAEEWRRERFHDEITAYTRRVAGTERTERPTDPAVTPD